VGKGHPPIPCPQAYTQAEAKGERDNPDLHFNKAVVLKYQADFPEAYGELLKAMELDPSLKVAFPLPHHRTGGSALDRFGPSWRSDIELSSLQLQL